MRKASLLTPAALLACVACTFDIPNPAAGTSADADVSTLDGTTQEAGATGDDGGTVGHDEAGSASDTSAGTDASCAGGSLCPCSNASDCASGICALSQTVGPSLYAAAGNANFCTKACCTSGDCDPGSVCFASGQGGNYCVKPSWLGRLTPGSSPSPGPGGAACTSGTQCRSGLCLGSGACADTCCSFSGSAAECTNGSQCAFGNFQGTSSIDTHFTGRCGPPGGSGPYGASCNGNTQCAGGLCAEGGCTHPCATSQECGSGGACQLDQQGSDIYAACFLWNGTGPLGSACSNDNQCVGDWCMTNRCSNVCFTDAVCMQAVSGWRCTPQEDDLPSGSYLVLACGPP